MRPVSYFFIISYRRIILLENIYRAWHLRFKVWTGSPDNSLGGWGVLLRDSAAVFVHLVGGIRFFVHCSAVHDDQSTLIVAHHENESRQQATR